MRKLKSFFFRRFEVSLVLAIVIGILAIAFLVYYKFSFLNFFFLPVILSGYYLGKRHAVLSASFSVLLVILYLVFVNVNMGRRIGTSWDEIITLVTWAGFLILTGGIIGSLSEEREARIKKLRQAYMGVLDILLRYLELGDENETHTMRVALLAGKIAKGLGLSVRESENIKSAAMLLEAAGLRNNLALFDEVGAFMREDFAPFKAELGVKDRIMLETVASLLAEVRPILDGYVRHYVRDAGIPDKNLSEIPIGSSIVALADHYDKITSGVARAAAKESIKTLMDIEMLRGRAFPASAVQALFDTIPASERTAGI
jgi:hypothetical protein